MPKWTYFGQPDGEPLSLDQRGVILSPPIHIDGSYQQVSTILDLQELRFSLLMFDRIDILGGMGFNRAIKLG